MSVKRIGLGILFFLAVRAVQAQNYYPLNFLEAKQDTIYFTTRSGGKKIDSLDKAYYNLNPSLLNNGRAYLPAFRDLSEWGGRNFQYGDARPKYLADYHFAGLPYVGFFYSFGSKLDQVLDLRFAYNLNKKWGMSFRFHRSSDNGQMRQMKQSLNDLNLKLSYRGTHVRSYIDAYFGNDKYQASGGISDSSELQSLALPLVSVNRLDASVHVKRASVSWKNYFALGKDSTAKFSLYVAPSFHTYNRRYTENSVDTSAQPTAFVNPLKTNDNFQEPHALLDAGVQFKNKTTEISVGYVADYWQYNNWSTTLHGLDQYIVSGLDTRIRNWQLVNALRVFTNGNPVEFTEKFNAIGNYGKHSLGAEVLAENYFIQPFQMNYRSNHAQWVNAYKNSTPTTRYYGNVFYQFGGKQNVRIQVADIYIQHPILYQNNAWINASGAQNILSPKVSTEFRFWRFVSQSQLEAFVSKKNIFQHPDFRIRSRFFINTPLFKAKIFRISCGVEVQYYPNYNLSVYNTELGLFDFQSTYTLNTNSLQLGAFLNMQIDQFRFSVSAQNLDYLWEPRTSYNAVNYPARPLVIRLAITWDFFN